MSGSITRPLLFVSQHHEANLCRLLSQRGWKLLFATDAHEVQAHPLDEQPIAGLLDLTGEIDDVELEALEPWFAQPNIAWIAMVDCRDRLTPTARRLLGLYFIDYLTAPFESVTLAQRLGHGWGMVQLRQDSASPNARAVGPAGMVGECEAMQTLFRGIAKVARWDAPVLIGGESGTGKELAAQAIHRASARAAQPFVALNCAAIPPALLQSELFGYERGAFTGALKRKPGRIELAQGGTLFLDEIGDMPLESQTSLLRFLETGCIERLGGTESVAETMRASSRRRTSTSRPPWPPAVSARTCITGCACCASASPRCASAAATSCCWPSMSWPRSGGSRRRASRVFRTRRCGRWPCTGGRAMCAS